MHDERAWVVSVPRLGSNEERILKLKTETAR
jgi:hypothetical protein